ncbi:hypothetical protein ACNKHW_03260 [Shigella flexneri]
MALPRSVFLALALHAIVEAGAGLATAGYRLLDNHLKMMLEDARTVAVNYHRQSTAALWRCSQFDEPSL